MMHHEFWMKKALLEAENAFKQGEVPVGAVIVGPKGELICTSHNEKEQNLDPCGHAEVIAIKKAAEILGSWRLSDCKLYVTLEPCMMCTGAIIQSRLSEVIFGALDPKGGFVKSLEHGFEKYPLNHRPQVTGLVLQTPCSLILKKFFKERRK